MITIDGSTLRLNDAWELKFYSSIKKSIHDLNITQIDKQSITIDGSDLESLDTNGCMLIYLIERALNDAGKKSELVGFKTQHYNLYEYVKSLNPDNSLNSAVPPRDGFLTRTGKGTVRSVAEQVDFLAFFGMVVTAMFQKILRPWTIRWQPFWANVQSAGLFALPIVGLLNFLIGLVITYQGGTLLQMFGMNIFAVHLITIATLRVLGPLLTAIIVAGRTGSAYAAQIGTMKVNEEVDALNTFGINSIDQLVIPKVFALILTLPFLTVFADIAAISGGMLYSNLFLDISYAEFIEQIPKVVTINSFIVSIIQAPIFAIIIVLVGCYQGFQVEGGADSVGTQTTKAVVQAIFLVIIFEAIFSIATRSVPL